MSNARSLQSLWKIITGHSAITDHDLILEEVNTVKDVLVGGLSFYKPRSSASELKLKSSKSVKGRKLDFVVLISKNLDLDELQSLDLFQNFLLEGYRGSFSELNGKLTSESEKLNLLRQVEHYYQRERLYMLRCVKQFFGYWQDSSHPYREVYTQSLVKIEFDGAKFIPGVWKQFENLFLSDVPAGIESLEEESKWLKQNILEQIELMEILLLFYKDYEMPIDLVTAKFQMLQKRAFGLAPRGRFTPTINSDPFSIHLSSLCVLVLLEALDLEYLLQIQDNQVNRRPEDHSLSSSKVAQNVKDFEYVLKDANHTPCHTPLLLSWFILRYMLCEEDGDITTARLLGDIALQGNVFEVICRILKSPFFMGERPVAGVCQSMYYTLLSLSVTLFNEASLGSSKVLYEIASSVLSHPRMRLTFWEKGLTKGLGLLLKGATARFPYNETVDLLIPLSQDEYSAHCVHTFMSKLDTYTEELIPHSLAKAIDIGPRDGTWMLRINRPVLEPEYRTLGLSPLVLERGTVGEIVEEGVGEGGNEVHLVSWRVLYSGWDLFAAMVLRLLSTPGIGVDPKPHSLIDFISKMYDLAAEVIKYNGEVVMSLKPSLSLIYNILQKFSLLPHPPAPLISSCIGCLAVMEGDLWTSLNRTGFLPQLLSPLEEYRDNLQTSPGSYGLLLNNWERARGTYPVTMAMLRLLLNTLKSPDRHMIREGVVASTVYIMQAVFVSSHNWRYQSQIQRDRFCHQLLSLCSTILQKGCGQTEGSPQSILHGFVVDLLLHSTDHLLLVNTLGTGVNTIDRMTASAISSSQPAVAVDSLKLCFTITDLLLKNKTTESVTHLEQTLATRILHPPSLSPLLTPFSQHLITELFKYVYHHDDPLVPLGAIKLLGRLAAVAPMSMFSCIGQDSMALRDCFNLRLSSVSEDTELRMAILQLVCSSIGTQPGILELFLSLKKRPDKSGNKENKGGETIVYYVDEDSCLWPVLDMIDPELQSPPVPVSLLSCGMRLLRSMWHVRHTGALEAVRGSRDSYWQHMGTLLVQEINTEDTGLLTHRLHTASHVISIVAMELYYAMQHKIDESLKKIIKEFIKKDGFTIWCKSLRNVTSTSSGAMDTDLIVDKSEVSLGVLKAQELLAESWRTLLVVAANHHEGLFELHVQKRKSNLLEELVIALESQVELLPHSVGVMSNILSLCMFLVRKWESTAIDSQLLGTLSNILEKTTKCESSPDTWDLHTLLYSTILVSVTALRKVEEDIEPRFVCGLVPSVLNTIEKHTYYDKLIIKHHPEVYAITLLSEVTTALPDDHSLWLDSLRHHSIVMILVRMATGYLDAMSRPEIIEVIIEFFLNLAKSPKGAELLQVNKISYLLTVPLGNFVSKLETMGSSSVNPLTRVHVPPPEWMRVWLSAVKLETRLLNALRHQYIDNCLDFVGAHFERLQLCLDIYPATRHLQATTETKVVSQFIQQLVYYKEQWMFGLINQHNCIIEKIVRLLNGSVAVLSRGRIKDLIKTMDSQGLLKPEHGSASVRAQGRQRRSSSGQVIISPDDDSWVKCSPAYLQLQDELLSIVTACVTILNFYSPPLSDMFMCTLAQPVDLSQWPPLFIINSTLPVVDPTSPPSITTLTTALTIGCDALKKLDPQSGHHRTSSARSPSKSSPIRSPVTPFVPRLNSEIIQHKRNEILYMLEQTVSLIISQSLRYLLDENVHPFEIQGLKKQLVSELSNFCQTLLINFTRKGAPSPHTHLAPTPLSSSSTTFQDNLSGRASSHSFSDSLEQGMFKLADMFAKNLTR